jgi:hypothetical protein
VDRTVAFVRPSGRVSAPGFRRVAAASLDPVLLDSYEAEWRPVAEIVTASDDAVELAQTVIDPTERRARDEALRAIFANPDSRHHEAVAEAELNIDYGGSPIVMRDKHAALTPGKRLPDTIEVCGADGRSCMLHELANRAGHTALLRGGSSIHTEALDALTTSSALRALHRLSLKKSL